MRGCRWWAWHGFVDDDGDVRFKIDRSYAIPRETVSFTVSGARTFADADPLISTCVKSLQRLQYKFRGQIEPIYYSLDSVSSGSSVSVSDATRATTAGAIRSLYPAANPTTTIVGARAMLSTTMVPLPKSGVWSTK